MNVVRRMPHECMLKVDMCVVVWQRYGHLGGVAVGIHVLCSHSCAVAVARASRCECCKRRRRLVL